MRIVEVKWLDHRMQRLADVVRALNLRAAEIKSYPPVTGTQQPRLPSSTSQHRAKCALTSYFDTTPWGVPRGRRLKGSIPGPPRLCCSVWAISTGCSS